MLEGWLRVKFKEPLIRLEGKRARWKGHEVGESSGDQKKPHIHCEPKEPGTLLFFFFFGKISKILLSDRERAKKIFLNMPLGQMFILLSLGSQK